ncbi:MAG: 4Fe-4S binding protein [Methanoculleaceae archaeon]
MMDGDIESKMIHRRGGVITERGGDLCTVRVRIPGGFTDAGALEGLARIARKFGDGSVHLTVRQTAEIPHVDPARLEEIEVALKKNGTPVGAEREEVVNVVACPGIDRCKYANVETFELAHAIDRAVFARQTATKVRIAIAACPYNCTAPQLSEIGIIGRMRPLREPGLCNGCGTCMEYCRQGAISIKDGISVLDESRCVECGVCIRSCPYGLIRSEQPYYQILVGGVRGSNPRIGRELIRVSTPEEVVAVVERVVYWIYRRSWSGRLLGDQLDDINFPALKEEIEKSFSRIGT